jgi:hypothetical protein
MVSESQASTKLPLGARLRLANTPAVNTLISNMPPESQIIARSMQQYGLILADIGSAMYVTGSSATVDNVDSPGTNLTWNLNDIFASNGLRVLNAGDFEVVNLTPVVTGLGASSGPAGSTLTISGQNFSGAAGHLSVFFGSTAASSVTIVSDSQLSVVVPGGSGTVNVTVQSGLSETDTISDNPNANVNAPIFGYGTSGALPFTYSTSGQTISGTNSTVSLAASSTVSGNTDLLTIVVEDTSGNPVGGLGSSAFTLNLAGGTSAGTFSAVAVGTAPGTYTAVFTGTTAGTASTLTVAVNGVTLSIQPTVTVTPGPVSATVSTVSFASSTVAAGSTDGLTIAVKDAAGNPISGLASSAFTLGLSGGTSAGTFSAVTAAATPGTYTATFTGTTAGTASALTVTVSGLTLSAQPTVQVTGGTTAGPTVSGVTPASGPAAGGTSVTIMGTNFTGATRVVFGSKSATKFTVVSATEIIAVSPAGTAGRTVDIKVTTPSGTSAASSADTFRYYAAPKITTQPTSVTVTAGQPTTFTVVATGDALSYQWQKLVGSSWVNVTSKTTSSFTGANTASLTITSTVTGDAGKYRVVVSNGSGTVNSNGATLVVKAATATKKTIRQ